MTIKELYEEAVRLGREDWDITVYDYDGVSCIAGEFEWEEEYGEVFIRPSGISENTGHLWN